MASSDDRLSFVFGGEAQQPPLLEPNERAKIGRIVFRPELVPADDYMRGLYGPVENLRDPFGLNKGNYEAIHEKQFEQGIVVDKETDERERKRKRGADDDINGNSYRSPASLFARAGFASLYKRLDAARSTWYRLKREDRLEEERELVFISGAGSENRLHARLDLKMPFVVDKFMIKWTDTHLNQRRWISINVRNPTTRPILVQAMHPMHVVYNNYYNDEAGAALESSQSEAELRRTLALDPDDGRKHKELRTHFSDFMGGPNSVFTHFQAELKAERMGSSNRERVKSQLR